MHDKSLFFQETKQSFTLKILDKSHSQSCLCGFQKCLCGLFLGKSPYSHGTVVAQTVRNTVLLIIRKQFRKQRGHFKGANCHGNN